MIFKIFVIGKIKNKNLAFEIEELKKRINRLEIVELKEVKEKNNIELIKKKEFELFRTYISSNCYNVLLWEHGNEFSTFDFYKKLKKVDKPVCFFITGAFGPSESLKERVDLNLSLSKMTFSHEQALYLLFEQLYRLNCIEKNIPYNK